MNERKAPTTLEIGPAFWGMVMSIFVAGVSTGVAMVKVIEAVAR